MRIKSVRQKEARTQAAKAEGEREIAQTKRKPAGQKRKAEGQAKERKAAGERENVQTKRNGRAKDRKHKVGTESGGGTGDRSNKAEGKGEARTGFESVRHD